MQTFRLWLEDREEERTVRIMFLKRLGFDAKNAIHDPDIYTIKLRSISDKIMKALNNIGLEEDKEEELKNWVKSNKESRLQDLLNQIDPHDVQMPSKEPEMKWKAPKKNKPQREKPNIDQMYKAAPPIQANQQVPM